MAESWLLTRISEAESAILKFLHAYIDGASKGNPGKAGAGAMIKNPVLNFQIPLAKFLGIATNNQAEYSALILLLQFLIEHKSEFADCTNLMVFSDSELLVRQMNGKYKIKSPNIIKYHIQVRKLIEHCGMKVSFQHIPREDNREADQLANQAINEYNLNNSGK